MMRLCVAAGLVVAAGLARGQVGPDVTKEKMAELNAKSLMKAVEAYYLNPQSGNTYPDNLAQLVKPPFGGTPYVRDPKDIVDPWGKQYKLDYAPLLPDGNLSVFVWSERVVDGKTKVYGKKPPELEPKKK